jgi:hypothetical protein
MPRNEVFVIASLEFELQLRRRPQWTVKLTRVLIDVDISNTDRYIDDIGRYTGRYLVDIDQLLDLSKF